MEVKNGEKGITLVALIITIIVLVILAAVSIAAVYKSRIVEYAINGTQDYAKAGINENKVLDETEQLIESALDNLKKMNNGQGGGESKPEEPKGPFTAEELAKVEMIGKYVDYKSQGTDYTVDGTYSGTGENQIFTKNDYMKWRIWGVEGNKLLLISEMLAENIKLRGSEGYNNGVKILNDACSTAFGNSTYGSAIKVRSINQDDIDKVTNMTTDAQRKALHSSYGEGYNQGSFQNNCPNIYIQELGNTEGGTLDRSVQSIWYSGRTTFTSGVDTLYSYDISGHATQTMYDALLTNLMADSRSGSDDTVPYWVASRAVYPLGGAAYFYLFDIYNGKVQGEVITSSGSEATKDDIAAVRPIVEISLDDFTIGATGLGTADSRYSMELK